MWHMCMLKIRPNFTVSLIILVITTKTINQSMSNLNKVKLIKKKKKLEEKKKQQDQKRQKKLAAVKKLRLAEVEHKITQRAYPLLYLLYLMAVVFGELHLM